MAFLGLVLVAAMSPSPSPPPRLHTWLYARVYDARYLQASSLPGGNQPNETDENAMAIFHAGYDLGGGFSAGGTYAFSDPNALAGLSDLNQIPETYLAYKDAELSVKAGDQYFNSPWADTHFKLGLAPTAFQGVDAIYTRGAWTFEAAGITRFMSRTSSGFTRTNLLTGVADGVNTSGFTYGRLSYAPPNTGLSLNGYAYDVDDMVAFAWFSGFSTLSAHGWQPFIGAQGGVETNAGASYLGVVRSSIAGLIAGATPVRNITLSAALDEIPWRRADVTLPRGASCASAGYFLPIGVGECGNNANGTATVYYGGWASPYSDGYSTDPMYTGPLLEGPVDRRSPGNSQALIALYTSPNQRFTFTESYYWFDYSNPLATQATTEWDNVLAYYFGPLRAGRYRGLLFRYGYVEQHKSNVTTLGGVPLTRYSRFQVEYDT
ncbi:MAG TPA: hypothetical protein VMG98_00715 [Verrucomicrobiae bacterium]|nr:hypothetical protein [Verrucomicrobiae bacterium]